MCLRCGIGNIGIFSTDTVSYQTNSRKLRGEGEEIVLLENKEIYYLLENYKFIVLLEILLENKMNSSYFLCKICHNDRHIL